jgi:hypothetical protein
MLDVSPIPFMGKTPPGKCCICKAVTHKGYFACNPEDESDWGENFHHCDAHQQEAFALAKKRISGLEDAK